MPTGDPVALALSDPAAQAFAAGIAATSAPVEIQVPVIGGGVAGAGPPLLDPLRAHLRRYVTLPFAAGVEVVPARLGTDANLVGAARRGAGHGTGGLRPARSRRAASRELAFGASHRAGNPWEAA